MTLSVGTLVWEIRANSGSADNGGGFNWTYLDEENSYKWTASGSGTNEYYCQTSAGGDPSIATPGSVFLDGFFNLATQGTAGSLTASQWDYADNDTLGYSTIYVRLADGTDPDTKTINGNRTVGYSVGTDYSQQNTSQGNGTDLVIDATTNTDVTSAGYVFATADVGNVVNVTAGTGFTAGRYYIVSVSGVIATLDRAVGTVGSTGGTWRLGGSIPLQNATINIAPLYNAFIKADATHTLTGSITTTQSGNSVDNVKLRGYNTTRGDVWNSVGEIQTANRPTIACGANAFDIATDYHELVGWVFTTTSATGVRTTSACDQSLIIGCKSTNSSASASREAFTVDSADSVTIMSCEAVSTAGDAIQVFAGNAAYFCYAHDSDKGFTFSGSTAGINFVNCVADTCTTTGFTASTVGCYVNCVSYNNGIGFDITTGNPIYINCVANSCTTGLRISNANRREANFYGLNLSNNTSDFDSGLSLPRYRMFSTNTSDPAFTDAPNGDFTTGTNMDAGWPTNLIGTSNALNFKMGVVQNAAGGGGASPIGLHKGLIG